MQQVNTQHLRNYPKKPKQVYLFGTCIVDSFFPDSGMDAIELLEREGIEVIYPQGQSCCGQPAYNSGYKEEAKAVALVQVKQFPLDIPVVVISGSCGGMMRHHYLDLLGDSVGDLVGNNAEITNFCQRVFEFTEFLVHVLRLKPIDQGPKERVALHTSCAARREMGVHITGNKLISQLANVELVLHDYESECCGFGGTFAVKHADISAAMVADKSKNLVASDVVRYVSADHGCMMNINGALDYQKESLRGEHIASYLLKRIKGTSAKASL
ncbi:(Fe-S)-binding protein [Colwellia sp. 75C3]|uniref:(Fe-S)-binding protein n=1 Tax=Colwellia sp. 75C3 TaxID=888425 RepID=UPI0018E3D900|nr:(Fe-S)-binding protein [Colwellia sp. 75C3]